MAAIDIGQIQVNQKRVGFKIAANDDNGHTVFSFNGLNIINATPTGLISFQNLTATSDLPAGSTFSMDIIGQGVGQVTFTARGQQGNGQPVFDTDFTIAVVADPNTPGPPTHWVVVDEGQTVAQ